MHIKLPEVPTTVISEEEIRGKRWTDEEEEEGPLKKLKTSTEAKSKRTQRLYVAGDLRESAEILPGFNIKTPPSVNCDGKLNLIALAAALKIEAALKQLQLQKPCSPSSRPPWRPAHQSDTSHTQGTTLIMKSSAEDPVRGRPSHWLIYERVLSCGHWEEQKYDPGIREGRIDRQ